MKVASSETLYSIRRSNPTSSGHRSRRSPGSAETREHFGQNRGEHQRHQTADHEQRAPTIHGAYAPPYSWGESAKRMHTMVRVTANGAGGAARTGGQRRRIGHCAAQAHTGNMQDAEREHRATNAMET
jgi:hypothetical protein